LWFYAASAAEATMADWRAREAKAGRIFNCTRQTMGGFPFRIEVRCIDPSIELRGAEPLALLKATDLLVAAQIYEPKLLIAEFAGPLMVGEPGQPPGYRANWTLAQSSLRGLPGAPERVSVVFDQPSIERLGEGGESNVLKAKRIELHGRLAAGSVADNPVVEAVLRATSAVAPELHSAAAQPFDADITATLKGLKDFAPKAWPARFRELQARGGTIEITNARLQQGDVIAVSAGTLGLTARGGLDGQLQLTVVGLEKALKTLDIERIVSEGKVGAAIGRLDRIMPGLSQIARQNATAPNIVASVTAMGKSTSLEGKPAVTVPLRFSDGAVMLGPIPLGRITPLF
jgi:hypothetical protein